MAKEAKSMREDFEDAISAIEDDDEGAITTETEADKAETDAEDLKNDAAGEKTETQAQDEAEKGEVSGEESGAETSGSDDADAGTDTGTDQKSSTDTVGVDGDGKADLVSAPVSWAPTAREGWKDLPEPVRQQIAKREKEIGMALEDGKDNRKTGEKFNHIVSQYAQVIAAEGATDPLTGVEELMKSVATLRMGSPAQKAQKIAGFIQHYGISIEDLDNVLSKQIKTGDGSSTDDPVARMIDEKMGPVNRLLSQMDAQSRKQNFDQNQKAINEVATFKQANEFYVDVQDDMADMVEMAGKRGNIMSLQDAYDKACAMNPEVSKIITARAANAALLDGGKQIAGKKDAASSISGKQGGQHGAAEDQSLHDTLAEAWDNQTG